MPMRPCLDCGRISQGSRCPEHQRQVDTERQRVKRQRRARATYEEDLRRARVVAVWRMTNGNVCPGYECEPHESNDLTADHVLPVAAGGDESGPLTVLCRACNGRKQAKTPGGGS